MKKIILMMKIVAAIIRQRVQDFIENIVIR